MGQTILIKYENGLDDKMPGLLIIFFKFNLNFRSAYKGTGFLMAFFTILNFGCYSPAHLFLCRTHIDRTYFNIIKIIDDKPVANTIVSGRDLRVFPLNSGVRQSAHCLHCDFMNFLPPENAPAGCFSEPSRLRKLDWKAICHSESARCSVPLLNISVPIPAQLPFSEHLFYFIFKKI